MPIYEYQCQACGNELEAMQKMSEEELLTCPSCGKDELKRLISASGFRLKGGGWYETDFKSKNQKNVDGGSKKSTESKNDTSKTKKSE